MELAKKHPLPDRLDEPNSLTQLINLYDTTNVSLQECADMKPANDAEDHDADIRQEYLLDIEAALLDQAAHFALHSDQDVLILMDIWAKAAGVETGQELTASDRIAMNIFRYLSGTKSVEN
jgi:hypothetical protein